MAQHRLYPDIPAEFPGLALESDYHLPFPAEEEEIVNENATSEAAAANAELSDDDLPSGLTNYHLPDLVEADSSDDKSDDDDEIVMTIVKTSQECPSVPLQL